MDQFGGESLVGLNEYRDSNMKVDIMQYELEVSPICRILQYIYKFSTCFPDE